MLSLWVGAASTLLGEGAVEAGWDSSGSSGRPPRRGAEAPCRGGFVGFSEEVMLQLKCEV